MYLHELTSSFILLQVLDYFTSATFFSLAIYILLRNPRASINRASFWLFLSFFVWSFSLIIAHNPFISKDIAALFYDIGAIGWASFGSLALYFAITLSGDDKLNRFKSLTLAPIPIFIFLQWMGLLGQDYVLQPWGWSFRWAHSVWVGAYYAYILTFVCSAFCLIFMLRQKGKNLGIRGQANIILLSGNISLILALITDMILPFLHIYVIPNIAPSCILFFAVGLIYAIGRYQFALSDKDILVQAEEQWAATFDAMAEGITIQNSDFEILAANKTICQLLGKTRDQLVGRKCYQVFHGVDVPLPLCPMVKSIESKKIEQAELFEPKLNRWLRVSTSPIFNQQGQVEKMVHIIEDITERKQAAAAIEKQYAITSAIINSPKGTLIFSLDSNYCYLGFNENHRQEMKMVYQAEIELGHSMLDYITIPAVRPLAKASFDRALRGESFIEEQLQPNTGVWYEFNWNPIKDKNGSVIGLATFIANITARKKTEEELHSKINSLEKFQKVTVDRELKMKELKAKIAELEAKLK